MTDVAVLHRHGLIRGCGLRRYIDALEACGGFRLMVVVSSSAVSSPAPAVSSCGGWLDQLPPSVITSTAAGTGGLGLQQDVADVAVLVPDPLYYLGSAASAAISRRCPLQSPGAGADHQLDRRRHARHRQAAGARRIWSHAPGAWSSKGASPAARDPRKVSGRRPRCTRSR
jgi:hypothetical protein